MFLAHPSILKINPRGPQKRNKANTSRQKNYAKQLKIIVCRIHARWNLYVPRYLSLHTARGKTMRIQLVTKSMAALLAAMCVGSASAAPLALAPKVSMFTALALGSAAQPSDSLTAVEPDFRRQVVAYRTQVEAGTIVIDTAHTFLYYVLGDGTAIRYGIGVGRDGFGWAGAEVVTRKAEWP